MQLYNENLKKLKDNVFLKSAQEICVYDGKKLVDRYQLSANKDLYTYKDEFEEPAFIYTFEQMLDSCAMFLSDNHYRIVMIEKYANCIKIIVDNECDCSNYNLAMFRKEVTIDGKIKIIFVCLVCGRKKSVTLEQKDFV